MSQRIRIWKWDTLVWIKTFAWIQIVGSAIFTVLLLIAASLVMKQLRRKAADPDPTSSCCGFTLNNTEATAAFVTLILLIFVSFVGIGMGIILIRGVDELLENDRYVKAWIIYTAITLTLVLACATVVGFIGVSAMTSKNT